MAVRAVYRDFGMSPKKVRRVLGLIRGKPIQQALDILRFIPSPVAEAVAKTVRSAVANAENNQMMAQEDLRIVQAVADDGPRLKRFRPQSRGRANPILRRSCHITIVVEEEVSEGGT
ncbi:MAG: 50S ribosomal protein L22 [Chloroflexi bacterium]|nr:50S ribosomal protein L22 [Chloroflexota bacterium]